MPFNSTSITPGPELFAGGNVGDGGGAVSMITGENPLSTALGGRRASCEFAFNRGSDSNLMKFGRHPR